MLDQPTARSDGTDAGPAGMRFAQAGTVPPEDEEGQAAAGTADPAPGEEVQVGGPQEPTAIEPPVIAGARVAIPVVAGQAVVLDDPAFDADAAVYVPVGEDLVITLADGRQVVLVDFFAHPDDPPTLSVLAGPAVDAQTLLASAVAAGLDEIEPAAAPPAEPVAVGDDGGGAGFRGYDPGEFGPGLPPLGPLGPTELSYGLIEIEPQSLPPLGITGEVDNLPPTITVAAEQSSSLITETSSFEFTHLVEFPFDVGDAIGREGQAVTVGANGGLDGANLQMDREREVEISFVDEVAGFKNVLGAYFVGADGTFSNVQIVFPLIEHAEGQVINGDTAPRPGGGPLSPGDSKTITVPAGATLGLFLISKGHDQIKDLVDEDGTVKDGGRLEFRHQGDTSQIFDLDQLDSLGRPVLVHIDGAGNEHVIAAAVFHALDPDPGDPSKNELNPQNMQQAISGHDDGEGVLIAFEDLLPGQSHYDADYNDAIFRVIVKDAEDVRLEAVRVGIDVAISDPDDSALSAAWVAITDGAQTGDLLFLDTSLFTVDADGNVLRAGDGQETGISLVESQDGQRLDFSGEATIEAYEEVLGAVMFGNSSADASGLEGARQISFQVFDPHDAPSNVAVLELTVAPPLDNVAEAQDEGALTLFAAEDSLLGDDDEAGQGGQTYAFQSLGDGPVVIDGFDAGMGDRLELSALFDGINFGDDPLSHFIRLSSSDHGDDIVVEVDLDGAGGEFDFLAIAVLTNPTGLEPGVTTAQDLVSSGQIVVA